jgi:uncharacterized protein (TIGR02646 family)
MIELEHVLTEPPDLTSHRKKNPNGPWGDTAFNPVRQIVRHQLNSEQQGLCVYCEQELDQNHGHIEHIKSKGLNPHLTFVYDYLAHSCDDPRHCGHHKKDEVLPIEPRLDSNTLFSISLIDGRLTPALGLTAHDEHRVGETVRILGLNCAALSWRRKSFADSVRSLNQSDALSFLQTAPFRWILRRL